MPDIILRKKGEHKKALPVFVPMKKEKPLFLISPIRDIKNYCTSAYKETLKQTRNLIEAGKQKEERDWRIMSISMR